MDIDELSLHPRRHHLRRLVYGDVSDWVLARIPHVTDFGVCQSIGVESNGKLVAGVVYHDYQPAFESIQISMAADSPVWARKEIIASLLDYPFNQLGCWMVFTLTPIDNDLAIRVNQHIGIEKKTVLPHAFGRKRHGVLCQMLRPAFLEKYGELSGKIQPISPSGS